MLQALRFIASISFAVFVVASASLVILVADEASANLLIAAMLAGAIALCVTLHCKSEIKDLTPIDLPPQRRYVAGHDEEQEHANAETTTSAFTISDADFDGE